MPREYEPKLFNRSEFPTYQHYLDHIKSLSVDEATVCDDFVTNRLEPIREGETAPRIHVIELYREFLVWSQDYPKLNHVISKQKLCRFLSGWYGRAKQNYYSLTYYETLLVPEPISQSLIKTYGFDKSIQYMANVPVPGNPPLPPAVCDTCGTTLDYRFSEPMECLVCKIEETKKDWRKYHYEQKKRFRKCQKATQAPRD